MIFKEVLWPIARKNAEIFKKERYWFSVSYVGGRHFHLRFLRELAILEKPRICLLYGANEFKI